MARQGIDTEQTLPGGPDPLGLEARVGLTEVAERLFGRKARVNVDRYQLERVVGRGANGTVFEALDTKLQRTVALKVLRAEALSDSPPRAVENRRREAQALARLSHPNVVQVYATGLLDSHRWIAMEFVHGTTLKQWAEAHPVRSAEAFERARSVLEQAGRGLAAAHAEGLVHRDFKPSNVLVGEDGRVRVADFGLARAGLPTNPDASSEPSPLGSVTAAAGTPRYMSPEQVRGGPLTAASDQFNFAVTAWELVFGTPPFTADSLAARRRETDAQVPDAPRVSYVPAPYARALGRALAAQPRARFQSMNVLLHELRPRARRRRGAALLGGGAALLGLASAAAMVVPTTPTSVDCREEAARADLAQAWGPERRSAVSAGLRRGGLPSDDAIADTVEHELDLYGDRWVTRHVDACQAQRPAQTLCLQHDLDTMKVLLARFEAGEAQAASRALAAVASLPPPAHCGETNDGWTEQTPAHTILRQRLATAKAELAVGRYPQAVREAQAIVAEASTPRERSIARDALTVMGTAWAEVGDERRFGAFESAYYLAAELGEGVHLAPSATAVALQYAYARKLADAEAWIRHAEAGLQRHPNEAHVIDLEHVRATVQLKRGEGEQSRATCLWVLERLAETGRRTSETAWLASSMLVQIEMWFDETDAAETRLLALRRQTTEAFGPAHPRLGRIAMLQGRLANARGEAEDALRYMKEGVEISERSYGVRSSRTGVAYLNLAGTTHRYGELETALGFYRRALRADEGARNQFTIRSLRGIADIEVTRGNHAAALRPLQEAVSIGREMDPPSPTLDPMRRRLAAALTALGHSDEAATILRDVSSTEDRAAPSRPPRSPAPRTAPARDADGS